jgi:hypothetical protein
VVVDVVLPAVLGLVLVREASVEACCFVCWLVGSRVFAISLSPLPLSLPTLLYRPMSHCNRRRFIGLVDETYQLRING